MIPSVLRPVAGALAAVELAPIFAGRGDPGDGGSPGLWALTAIVGVICLVTVLLRRRK